MSQPRPISKLLVANRGEIARRIFATCRAMGIGTVAVYSDPDAAAPFTGEADEAVPLGGISAADSYLRGEAIVDAARRSGADAIHPGYGFLAENAGFAHAVFDAGLIWVGPPPEAIEAMGSKVRARALMEAAGVPVLPGAELDGASDLAEAAERIGLPLLVKASAGGGGKGMRAVSDVGELEGAVAAARREAEGAFGDPTVFLERLLEHPRHVEIQVLADAHGTTVSLGERECSIQRRHQKVVEESPSPAVDPELRARMGAAAVAAAEAVGYLGAGTVELLLAEDGEFYFLEMNTRLQVEHPVTELVTGLDLVRLQLQVAAGEPLPPAAREVAPRGHAIEVRLYAEDPAGDFLPQTGPVRAIEIGGAKRFAPRGEVAAPGASIVRIDSGVEAGSEVSPHYDPMLAKAIAFAEDRAGAARRLAAALRTAPIHGLTTNRDFLVRVLTHPAFLAGETDTGFIDRHRPDGLLEPLLDREGLRLHALAAALAGMLVRRRRSRAGGVLGFTSAGWRNNPSEPQRVGFEAGGERLEVRYRVGRDGIEASVDGEEVEGVRIHENVMPATHGQAVAGEALGTGTVGVGAVALELEAGGVRRRYTIADYGDETRWVNSPLGQAALRELPRYPSGEAAAAEGALVAPMPGKVIKLLVEEGATVEAGAPLAVLEAMKMEHELTAPASGVLSELRVSEGEQVDSGAILGVIEEAPGDAAS